MFLFFRFPSLIYTFELAISLYFLFVLISFITSNCTFVPIVVDARNESINAITYGDSKKTLSTRKKHDHDDGLEKGQKYTTSSKGHKSDKDSKPFVKESYDESSTALQDVLKIPSSEVDQKINPNVSIKDFNKQEKILSPVVKPLISEESPKKDGSKTSQKKSITKEGSKVREWKSDSKARSISSHDKIPSNEVSKHSSGRNSSIKEGHKASERKNNNKEEHKPSQKKSNSKESSKETSAKKEVSKNLEKDGSNKQELSNTLAKGENGKKELAKMSGSVRKEANDVNIKQEGSRKSTISFSKEDSTASKADSTKAKSLPESNVKKDRGSSESLKKDETKTSEAGSKKSSTSTRESTKKESKSSELAKQSYSGESKKSITTILGERKSLVSVSKNVSPKKGSATKSSISNVAEAGKKVSLVESITSQLKFSGNNGGLYGLPKDNISDNLKLVNNKLIELLNSNMLPSTNTPIHNEHC